jgi:hypothetical protein
MLVEAENDGNEGDDTERKSYRNNQQDATV